MMPLHSGARLCHLQTQAELLLIGDPAPPRLQSAKQNTGYIKQLYQGSGGDAH